MWRGHSLASGVSRLVGTGARVWAYLPPALSDAAALDLETGGGFQGVGSDEHALAEASRRAAFHDVWKSLAAGNESACVVLEDHVARPDDPSLARQPNLSWAYKGNEVHLLLPMASASGREGEAVAELVRA